MISVCMATYNGSKYLELQLRSILDQIGPQDELIVVDDASRDDTIRLINEQRDSRVRVSANPQNLGVVRTFEKALSMSRGEIVFLADQDDIWYPHKVSSILDCFNAHPEATLVLSDARIVDGEGHPIQESWASNRNFTPGVAANLWRNRYVGCAMAFRSEMLQACLPFPDDIPMHDMWIGCINQLGGSVILIDEPLMDYRKHGANVTTGQHASIRRMLTWRWKLVKNLLLRTSSLKRGRATSRSRSTTQ
jgi:glycosyltransferase involved in cell wall biosynthesis